MNATDSAAPRTTASNTILAFMASPFDSARADPAAVYCFVNSKRYRLVAAVSPAAGVEVVLGRRSRPRRPADPGLARQALEAGAQSVAPVRQRLSVEALAPQRRIRGPGSGPVELCARDASDAAIDSRVVEDRLRELGPRAVAAAGDVP